ncbi:hypothetical protein KIKIMORA_02240 [Brevundimonas phage vB_BpoS-Kikimora]|uniref:Uncharacterized protein n=1 Tax=Brevundimonas phage vB_BpoS-Kikimora TaxID=2948601 RepID=A0A9E7SKX2_9CAUD|nr:hypothetical protein KIKIMORA_02240 [Brevundimonas phage vB_BpoS-Kikimora]
MRVHPFDDDTLFQVAYDTLGIVDNHPAGRRHAATFALNWMEACHMVRLKYGPDKAERVRIVRIYTIERLNDGRKIEHDFYTNLTPVPNEAAA